MSDSLALVGRQEELSRIDQLVREWDTRRILFVSGEGGVGKTRLIEEAHRRYSDPSERTLLATNIVDFDDRTLHIVENVEGQIMHSLGGDASKAYSLQLLNLHQKQVAGAKYQELSELRRQVRQCLVDHFNQVSATRRVIVLLDGVEKLESTNAWERLAEVMKGTRNALFILAGRNAGQLRDQLTGENPELAASVAMIDLGPLEETASCEYLSQKQSQLSITIDPDVADRILLLTEGKPILIDLAVEWLARNVAMKWLTSEDEWKKAWADTRQTQQQLQIRLVEHIGQIRTQMDRLILLMSRVYPVSADMVSQALNIKLRESRALLQQARSYTFVKSYRDRLTDPANPNKRPPNERIYLHDEIRRMIRDYVWPDIDPDGIRRKRDSEYAVEYLGRRHKALVDGIEKHANFEKKEREAGSPEKEFDAFVARQVLDQELWAVREQYLFHTLFVDTNKGVALFASLFDQATQDYEYSMREVLIEQMNRYIRLAQREQARYLTPLSPEQIHEIDICRAKFLLDDRRYAEAEDVLIPLLSTDLQPAQQVDALIQAANVVLRMGRYRDSIDLFKKAVAVSKSYDLLNWLVKAENGLGWAYRHTTNREEAREHYAEALKIARTLGLKHQQALLYSNLGFIYAYIPQERHKATSYCQASLSLWKELNDKRGKGRAHSALGCVNFMAGQFDEALSHFQQALDIFEPVEDHEWLSTVYSWRAAVYMSTDHLDLAEDDLHRSLKIDVARDRPMTLSRLGSLYLMRRKLEQAQQAIDESRVLALTQGDVLYQLISVRDLARLARYKKDFSQLENLEAMLQAYLHDWGTSQDRRALGMLYLNFGSLALGQAQLNKAIRYYRQGLEPLAEQDRYGRDTLGVQVERLGRVFVRDLDLKPSSIRRVGRELLKFWHKKGFEENHPDVLLELERWAAWKGV